MPPELRRRFVDVMFRFEAHGGLKRGVAVVFGVSG